MALDTWTLFLAIALAAVLSPGPAMLAIVGHALARGAPATIPVVLGNAAGVLAMMAASVFGLAAVITSIPHGFAGLKWAGVAYLLWLGVQAWRTRPVRHEASATGQGGRAGFVRGLAIALSNPKAILFFAAVLPQFVDPGLPLARQFAALAGTFVGLECLVTTAVAFGAHALNPLLRRPDMAHIADRVGGSIMILAAFVMASAASALENP